MVKIVVKGHELLEEFRNPLTQLGSKSGFAEIFVPGTADLVLPGEVGQQIRILTGFGSFIAACGYRLTGGSFHLTDHSQKFVRFGCNPTAEILHGGGSGFPDEETVVHTLRIDFKIQSAVFTPPFHILTDADPQTLFVRLRGMHPGIPVDPADLYQVAGLVLE